MGWGAVTVFSFPSERSGSIPRAVEAAYVAARTKADSAAQDRMNWWRRTENTVISILHIRQDFPLQNRLPAWRQARQLTPVVFNSQLLPFVLSFCCSKANPAQQQSGSGRWLPCLMDSCPHLKSRHHNCLQKFLMCFACGVWTQVKEVLQEDVCTVRAVKPATDSLQQNQKCQWLAPKGVMSRPPRERKWWLHQR